MSEWMHCCFLSWFLDGKCWICSCQWKGIEREKLPKRLDDWWHRFLRWALAESLPTRSGSCNQKEGRRKKQRWRCRKVLSDHLVAESWGHSCIWWFLFALWNRGWAHLGGWGAVGEFVGGPCDNVHDLPVFPLWKKKIYGLGMSLMCRSFEMTQISVIIFRNVKWRDDMWKCLALNLAHRTPCSKGFVNKLMLLEYFLYICSIIPNLFYYLRSSFSFRQTCFFWKKDLSDCNNHTLVNPNRAGTVSLFWVFGPAFRNSTNTLPRTGLYRLLMGTVCPRLCDE